MRISIHIGYMGMGVSFFWQAFFLRTYAFFARIVKNLKISRKKHYIYVT